MRKKLGFKDIHLIGQNGCLGSDYEATVDGVHYNDIGFQRFADHILKICEVLFNYIKNDN